MLSNGRTRRSLIKIKFNINESDARFSLVDIMNRNSRQCRRTVLFAYIDEPTGSGFSTGSEHGIDKMPYELLLETSYLAK